MHLRAPNYHQHHAGAFSLLVLLLAQALAFPTSANHQHAPETPPASARPQVADGVLWVPALLSRQARNASSSMTITMFAAGGVVLNVSVPTNGSVVSVKSEVSISKISCVGDSTIQCSGRGKDGLTTVVAGGEEIDVGPPQSQLSWTCSGARQSNSSSRGHGI